MKFSLPVIDCLPGCVDCCGPILISEKEYRRVERHAAEHGIVPQKNGVDRCCFAQNGRCAVHEVRPLVCRVFACVDDPDYTCPHGKNINVPTRTVQRAIERKERKEGPACRWLNEMVYSVAEMESGLSHVTKLP